MNPQELEALLTKRLREAERDNLYGDDWTQGYLEGVQSLVEEIRRKS